MSEFLSPNTPTFSSLPTPFFGELSATLSAQEAGSTLSNLNQTCRSVQWATTAGLYKSCRFREGDGEQISRVANNEKLSPMVREVWFGESCDSIANLANAFPNATSKLRTRTRRVRHYGRHYEDVELHFDVTSYTLECLFPIIRWLAEQQPARVSYHFEIASEAREAFKASLESQPALVGECSSSRIPGSMLVLHAHSEMDAASLLDTVCAIAPVISLMYIHVKCQRIEDWFDLEGQLQLISVLNLYPHLRSIEWIIDITTPVSDETLRSGIHTPHPALLQHLANTIGACCPLFSSLRYTLSGVSASRQGDFGCSWGASGSRVVDAAGGGNVMVL